MTKKERVAAIIEELGLSTTMADAVSEIIGKTRNYSKCIELVQAEFGETELEVEDTEPYTDAADPALPNEVDIVEVDLGDDEEEEPQVSGVVPKRYKDEYKARGDASCCGDDFSQVMKAATTVNPEKGKPYCDEDALSDIARENNLFEKLTEYRNKGLNVGMQRMNIGNILRHRLQGGEEQVWVNGRPQNPDLELEDEAAE